MPNNNTATTAPAPTLTVGLLGPVTAARGGAELAIAGSKPRTVLAVLASAPNRVVPLSALTDALWDGEPGDTAESSVRVHVFRLRKALTQGLPLDAAGPIETLGSGYRLRIAPGDVDAEAFERLRREAVEALRSGQAESAEQLSREALDLWRGPALADLPVTGFVTDLATALHEQRMAALEVNIDAQLAQGRAGDVVGQLRSLVHDDPLRESLTERLMLALYRSGRQAEALDAFAQARRHLDDELGLEPGAALQELQRRMLRQDPALDVHAPSVAPEESTARTERSVTEGSLLGQVSVDGSAPIPVTHEPWTIGRHTGSDLLLSDTKVSRRHAQIVTVDGVATIVDLASTNGTRVDGQAVTSRALGDGSVIGIGGHSLVFLPPEAR